jgi:hypothetical protein
VRPGPGDALELYYDFSLSGAGRDWRTSGSRLRRGASGIISSSGGSCSFRFAGALVSAWEVSVQIRFMEEKDAALEVRVEPVGSTRTPTAVARVRFADLRAAAREADAPLAKEACRVLFCRRWDGLEWRFGSRDGPVVGRAKAAAPRGAERPVLRLTGWIELRAARVRGAPDPGWRAGAKKPARDRAGSRRGGAK